MLLVFKAKYNKICNDRFLKFDASEKDIKTASTFTECLV